jgi:hypothetical protein
MEFITRLLTLSSSVTGLLLLLVTPISTPALQTGSVKMYGTILPRASTTHALTFVFSSLLVCVEMASSLTVLTISGTLQFTLAKIPAKSAILSTKMAALTVWLITNGNASMTLVMTSGVLAVADLCAEMVLFKIHIQMQLVLALSMKNVISAFITVMVMSTTMHAVLIVRRRELLQVSTYICGNALPQVLVEMRSRLALSFAVTES